ncbi:MAG TPA: glycine cleavage system protein GcvH [Ktedonobacterales bacterium]|jgi:glycine cleavage system H protein
MADLEVPANLKYSQTHEWVRVEGDEATVGITAYAQNELGDVVFVELPWDEAGREVAAEGKFGDVESVKAASELFSPVAGAIIRMNEALKETPDIVNSDPYGDGWMIVVKLSDKGDLDRLMDAAAYEAFAKTAGH